MEASGEFSKVLDFLSKLAGCSVLFLGFAFCAGYFYSSAYLKVFDSEWFLSGFTFVELVIRGLWNAVYAAIGVLVLFVVVQSPSVSGRSLLWLMRFVCYPFYFLFFAFVAYSKFQGVSLDGLYRSAWVQVWMMAALVCQAATYLHPESLRHVIFKVFSVAALFLLAYGVVVALPKISARDYAEYLQGNDRQAMLKAYKGAAPEVHYLVDSANGRLLLQRSDNSLIVVDPTNDWRILR